MVNFVPEDEAEILYIEEASVAAMNAIVSGLESPPKPGEFKALARLSFDIATAMAEERRTRVPNISDDEAAENEDGEEDGDVE